MARWLWLFVVAKTSLHAVVVQELKEGDLLFVHVPLDLSKPLSNAIQAVGNATIDWLSNHGARPSSKTSSFHVALAVGQDKVVEAVGGPGVCVTSVDRFFHRYQMGSRFFHGVVLGMNKSQRKRAVQFGLNQIGKPYAHDFRSPERTPEAYYCSSLVDYAFRNASQRNIFFTDENFPLIFVPQNFWQAYYHKRNMTIPTGVGSNPTLLLQSSKVRYTEVTSALSLNAKADVDGALHKNATRVLLVRAPIALGEAGGRAGTPFIRVLFGVSLLAGAVVVFVLVIYRLRSKRQRAQETAETVKEATAFLEDIGRPPN